MSNRHAVDRQQSVGTGANYVDGIPVKIGEKFKPPDRITLPLSYRERNPSEVLSEDYNFNLERQVVAWTEKHRKAKEQNAKAQVDKVAYQIEQFTRINHVPSEGSSDESPSGSGEKPLAGCDDSPNDGGDATPSSIGGQSQKSNFHVALLANLEHRDILKPVPLKAPSTVSHQSNYSFSAGHPHNNIKLEDFEAESSPFDSVELKTLNDMEELKSVLQGMVQPTPQHRIDSQPLALPSGSNPNLSETISSPKAEVRPLLNGTIEYYPGSSHINGAVMPNSNLSSSYPAPSSYNELPSIMRKAQQPFPNFSASQPYLPDSGIPCQSFHTTTASSTPYTNSVSQYSYVSSSLINPEWSYPDKPPVTSYGQADKVEYTNTQVASMREYTYASLYHPTDFPAVGSQNQAVTPGSDSSSGSSNSSLRNARSTPDLLKELGRPVKEEILERKRQLLSHPPRPNSVGSVEEAAANSTAFGKHRTPPPINGFETFNELDEEGKRLVHQMMDMGFPRPRSALAVKKLGVDDKKVVEHLCAVQNLTEKGFDPDRAAAALHLHNQDELAAQTYLQLMKQFLDLGFDEASIQKALALHKNDRDKALDYLVS